MFYLVIILFGVGWILLSIIRNYVSSKNAISNKYLNHGKNVPVQKYSNFNVINPLKNKAYTLIRTYSTFTNKENHQPETKGLNEHNKDISSPLVYVDAHSMKKDIIKENIGKSGVYMWTNLCTGDVYVGQSARNYSTFINKEDNQADTKESNVENFYEWLCGLTDGEGAFIISSRGSAYAFSFEIRLHEDDQDMLNFIQRTLDIGKVYTYGKTSKFMVTKQKDMERIINIFSTYPLNTTKYLNFLDFKKAFELYTSSTAQAVEIGQEIAKIKSGINSLRSEFEMPKDKEYRITPYWLLGFVEGEGSFHVQAKYNYVLVFALWQSAKDLALMKEIKNFFNNLSKASRGEVKTKSSDLGNVVSLSTIKRKTDPSEHVRLAISRTDYITNELIPLFDSMIWRSKKYLDYQDWKAILNLRQLGLQYKTEGLNVIKLILSQMNNKRLSSAGKPIVDRTLLYTEINRLLNGPSNYQVKEDGRIFIKSSNRYISTAAGRDKIKVEVKDENGSVINTFDSISSCAKFFCISRSTTQRRLQNNKPVIVQIDNKPFYVKMVTLSSQRSAEIPEGEEAKDLIELLKIKATPTYTTAHIQKTKNEHLLNTNKGNPVNIYEKCSSEGFKLIGSFVSARRAAKFLDMSGSTVIRYMQSGGVYKDRYKFSSK